MPYQRPPQVEAEIDSLLLLAAPQLDARLQITNRQQAGYLSSESLVYLLRQEVLRLQGSASRDERHLDALLQHLLRRCEAILMVNVQDSALPNAADVRQQVMDDLVDLFLPSDPGHHPEELDLYECKFNLAFRALRVDAVRAAQRRCREIHLSDMAAPQGDMDAADAEEEVFDRIHELSVAPEQENYCRRQALHRAIGALPAEQRQAVTLVHILGYSVESDNPEEKTAATICGCTGRTIRNRLRRAAQQLAEVFSAEDL
jgi:hypothetical protein